MSGQDFVKGFKKDVYGTTNAKELAEGYSIRIRQTKASKDLGADVWEVATEYFYRSQNTTERLVQDLKDYVGQDGYEVEQLTPIQFATKVWPEVSWAWVFVRIV